MTSEQKLYPSDPSTKSWRDKTRELITLKYGKTGENVIEGLLGESEEDKYMKYLEKVEAGLLPKPEGEYKTGYRPLRDMKHGVSDIGIMDFSLMGLSSMKIPTVSTSAALTESAVLGADAVGEYKKGNTGTAAIMGTLAGVPPLLRYTNPVNKPVTKTSSEEVADKIDPTRRNIVQGIGALAVMAPFSDPLLMAGKKILTKAPIEGLSKLTQPIPKLASSDFLNINSKIIDKVARNIVKDSKLDDLADAGIEYEIQDLMSTLSKTDTSKLSFPEIKKLFNDEALRLTKQNQYTTPEISKEMYELFSSDAFIKHTINGLEEAKLMVRNDPELFKLIKEATDAEKSVMDLPGGFTGNVVGTPQHKKYLDTSYKLEKYANNLQYDPNFYKSVSPYKDGRYSTSYDF
tara:strand:+ start:37 stop:1245 length:1209 start_codon:yes stop_codon:yes gene_type:complete